MLRVRSERKRQLPIVAHVTSCRSRAAHCAARLVGHCSNGRHQQSRGVSDHAKWPLALPSRRPRTWSLTPRLNRLPVSVSASKIHPLMREDPARNLENNSMNIWAVF